MVCCSAPASVSSGIIVASPRPIMHPGLVELTSCFQWEEAMRFKHLLSGILWGERRHSPLPTLMTSVGVQYPVLSLLCLPAERPSVSRSSSKLPTK